VVTLKAKAMGESEVGNDRREQAALKLWGDEDTAQARKYFSLSARDSAYHDFRVDPVGYGLAKVASKGR
jgi:hypothetical protein